MIATDANVLVHLLLGGERTAAAEALVRADPHWLAPPLWRSEFRNVLARLVRRGQLPLDASLALMAAAERRMQGGDVVPESASVLALAAQSGCTAYDCEYVAVALASGVKLVTEDRQVLAAFPAVAVGLGE